MNKLNSKIIYNFNLHPNAHLLLTTVKGGVHQTHKNRTKTAAKWNNRTPPSLYINIFIYF